MNPHPDANLRMAYTRAQKAGITSEALTAVGKAMGHGQPSSSWTVGQNAFVALLFHMAEIACLVYPPDVDKFNALASGDGHSNIVALWFTQALLTIEVVDPELVQSLRNVVLATAKQGV